MTYQSKSLPSWGYGAASLQRPNVRSLVRRRWAPHLAAPAQGGRPGRAGAKLGAPLLGQHWALPGSAGAPGSRLRASREKLRAGLRRAVKPASGGPLPRTAARARSGPRRPPGLWPRSAPGRSLGLGSGASSAVGGAGLQPRPHSRALKPSGRQASVPEGSCCLRKKLHLHSPATRGPGVAPGARRTLLRDPPAPHRPALPDPPHQVPQPQPYLRAPESPGLLEDARATDRDLGAAVRGGTQPPIQLLSSCARGSPGVRAWWFSLGAPWLGTSEKMPAMRLFTCFLQLLAGLALPAVPPQVRPPPPSLASLIFPPPALGTGGSEITDPLPGAAPPRMSTHFPRARLDHVVWEESAGRAVPDLSSGVCLGGGGEATGKGGRFPVWPLEPWWVC